MQIQVIIFGQLTDIIKTSPLIISGISDTDELLVELNNLYPALRNAKYVLAVNKKTIIENTNLQEGNIVALLPPFSGG